MSDDVIFSFAMDEKMNRKLKDLAESEHRTLAGQIRLILEEYLDRQK